jgi:hypothetical protein
LMESIIIRRSQVHVWRGVGIVVWLEVGGNGVLEMEIWLANSWRFLVALFESGRTSKQEGKKEVPGQKPRG